MERTDTYGKFLKPGLIGMAGASIGFIGTGQMARAMARGITRAGIVAADAVFGYDRSESAVTHFERELPGARCLASNRAVVDAAEIVILAVKPQNLRNVAAELGPVADSQKLFVSLLAGVPIRALSEALGHQRVVRVMPNTPCLVGCGASAYALGPQATVEDGQRVAQILTAVGVAVLVDEGLLDAVTGLSGSGPAYVYTVIEALSDGGVRVGLPREMATQLAAQTVLGAAQMVLATAEHPGTLRDRVTSPGGTTIAGLQVLERRGMRSAFIDAVEAATQRAVELGKTSR